jgi:hypothetical protein
MCYDGEGRVDGYPVRTGTGAHGWNTSVIGFFDAEESGSANDGSPTVILMEI